MKLQNKIVNNVIASGTDNVVVPTESQNREGIAYKSETKSNVPNGFFYSLSEAIQFLQFTVGLYDASAEYTEGNICKLLYKDASGYQLKSFRRNNKHNTIVKGNAPYKPATITTANGIDCYSEGTANEDWEEIKSGLSAYIFQVDGKTINDLIAGGYNKDTISVFLSSDKFTELYNVCRDFTQVYFLDCLVSYKSVGERASGSEETGDLKNYRFVDLNINAGGSINIRFEYNDTDAVYNEYYLQGLQVGGQSLLQVNSISSEVLNVQGDKSKIIPNMLAIEKINNDIEIIRSDSMKELIIDLDLQLESNVKQTINLLDKIQAINPHATKVTGWEMIYWQSAREKKLEELGWEDEYLLSNSGTHANNDELTSDGLQYASGLFLEGSFYSFCVNRGVRPTGSTKNGITKIKALQKDADAYADAYTSANADADAYASASAYASAYANAVAFADHAAYAYAYAKRNGIAYNYIHKPTSLLSRKVLASENNTCQWGNNTTKGNFIDRDKTAVGEIYYKQTKTKVPIIVYSDTFELKYTYKRLDKAKTDSSWATDFNNGDKLLFKPKLKVSYY